MGFNQNASVIFGQIGQMLELLGGDRFRVNAANKASRELKSQTLDLESMAKAEDIKGLTAIEGIGKGTAGKLVELAQRGKISEHVELSEKIPAGLMAVLAVPGLGPKTVKLMWDDLKIESIEDLKRGIADGSVEGLPRMGAKTIENISAAIEFQESSGGRLHLGIARPIAVMFVELMESVEGTIRVDFAGSIRRGEETIGDIDILIATSDADAARAAFVGVEGVTRVLAEGETKCSVRFAIGELGGRFTGLSGPEEVQVDLRIVDQNAWGAAMCYFTGSKDHNVVLRRLAIKQGLTLNEYGLFKSSDDRGDPMACETEQGIYTALGIAYVPAPLRQDRGEIQYEELPDLVEVSDIRADLHTHTVDSDGKMTLAESVEIAMARGFHTLAITDHSRSSVIANGLKADRLREQIEMIHAFDKKTKGISVLAGSEVDILVDGSLDYDDDLLNALDVVVASPHAGLKAKPKQATKRLLKAIEHPAVHIIGHPTGRLIGRREGLEPDMNEIIAAAVEHDVALEINAHWLRLDLRDTHVRAAVGAGCKIAIDCDVHQAGDYNNLIYGVLTGQRGWLTPELCLNCWDHERLHGWLKSKRS